VTGGKRKELRSLGAMRRPAHSLSAERGGLDAILYKYQKRALRKKFNTKFAEGNALKSTGEKIGKIDKIAANTLQQKKTPT